MSACSPICGTGTVYNAVTLNCDTAACTDTLCLVCPISVDSCTSCDTGYTPINGVCSPFCGDAIVIGT